MLFACVNGAASFHEGQVKMNEKMEFLSAKAIQCCLLLGIFALLGLKQMLCGQWNSCKEMGYNSSSSEARKFKQKIQTFSGGKKAIFKKKKFGFFFCIFFNVVYFMMCFKVTEH